MLRLGVDLGTNSIGWCLLCLNDSGDIIDIVSLGVRIFSDGRDGSNELKLGDPLNQKRTADRSARKNRRRTNNRIESVADILTQYNLIPKIDKDRKAFHKIDPLKARADAATGKVDVTTLGRALLNLSKRRGYKSNRIEEKDTETKKQLIKIDTLRKKLKQSDETLGQYLYKKQFEVSNRDGLVKQPVKGIRFRGEDEDFPDREMYLNEFNRIKNTQEPEHKFGGSFWNSLEEALFRQGKLKPQEKGRCTYLVEEPRCYKAVPSFQFYRMLSDVNNLKWFDDKARHNLNELQQQEILKKLVKQKTISFKALKKLKVKGELLFPNIKSFNLEDERRDKLLGNETLLAIQKTSAYDNFKLLSSEKQDGLITSLLEAFDEENLNLMLREMGFDDKQSDELKALKLPKTMSSLSAKFCRLAKPHLEQGRQLAEVVVAVGQDLGIHLHHSDFEDGEVFDQLPYYGQVLQGSTTGRDPNASPDDVEKYFGKIANPTVHVALNQLRVLLNNLVKQHGQIDEISIELTRQLKNSRKAREEITKRNATNKKNNDRLAKILEEQGKDVRRTALDRLKLWEELGHDEFSRCCIFSGQPISKAMVLNGEADIEHILPRSRTLDNSMSNIVLATRTANQLKGTKTPFEAFGHDQHISRGYSWEEIMRRIDILPKAKQWRFYENAMEMWQEKYGGFLDSQLTDTAYISKLALKYVKKLVGGNNAWSVTGSMTSELRGRWNLNGLLSDHNQKNRSDHRHHAIDAFVIALTDRKLLKKFMDSLHKDQSGRLLLEGTEMRQFNDHVVEPLRDQLKEKLAKTYASHKPDHGQNAIFFNETAYGYIEEDKRSKDHPEYDLVYRKNIIDLTQNQIDHIRDEGIRKRIQEYISNAFAQNPDLENASTDKIKKEVTRLLNQFSVETGIKSIRLLEKNDSITWKKNAPHKVGYTTNSYCFADIWRIPLKKGKHKYKYQGEFVTYIEAMKGEERIPQKPHPAAKRMMRLYKQDTVMAEIDGILQPMRVAGFSTTNNRLDLHGVNAANAKKKYYAINVIGEALQKINISPIGKIRRSK